MTEKLISLDRSVIPAADVDEEDFPQLLRAIQGVHGIEIVKTGAALGYDMSLRGAVSLVHEHGLKALHDHQKAGTEIPDTASRFARSMRKARVDGVILFPLSGPVTEEAWIKAIQDIGVPVLVGGEMTHKGFKRSDDPPGFIADEALDEMYEIAASLGVTEFVVPGNKVDRVSHYHSLLSDILGYNNFTFYSPGFVAQGGKISSYASSAGHRWHAIAGRVFSERIENGVARLATEEEMHAAALEMTSQIR